MHDQKVNMTIRHLMDGSITINDSLEYNVNSLPVVSDSRFGKLVLDKRGFTFQ